MNNNFKFLSEAATFSAKDVCIALKILGNVKYKSKNNVMSKKNKNKVWWKPCEHCGYKTNFGTMPVPRNSNKYCWRCGRIIYRDHDKQREMKTHGG